ncbi:MAG: sulfatase-like hydrolase/transferase [Pirellulales bacterium]
MSKRTLLLGLVAVLAYRSPGVAAEPAGGVAAEGATGRPNIIVIVADDLGYGEIIAGPRAVPMPHVQSIAQNGVTFTNGYVTCPVCSPTRAGLLTGRYQQRFGHEFNPGPANSAEENFGLPLDQVTLADRLKKLGYATGMVGKWHLGYRPEFHPLKRGFDEYFGFLGGAHSYVDSAADAANKILRGTESVEEKGYLTDAFGREAVAFIDRHKAQPFFLYLTFNAVHAPLEATEKYRERFTDIGDERRRTYAAMQSAMDDNVGAVLAKLRDDKIEDHTLVVFIADNGGPTPRTTSSNGPLHGYKSQVWEGGTRVPYLVQWKSKLPAGKTYELPVSSLDIVPTCVVAAGGSISADDRLDGVDLAPYLTGQNSARPHETLFWRFGQQWAVRQGDYKLLQPNDGPVQLFDLAADIGEQHDLAAAKPEVRNQLEASYAKWNAELTEPRWKGRRAGAGRANANRVKARAKKGG